jgi:hypothetical protein
MMAGRWAGRQAGRKGMMAGKMAGELQERQAVNWIPSKV